ncbi:MAG: PhnD/SsuA/transferrin family substrate-binding protein, partial [Planctomycetia bacterium]|nr:PhnD/SsuA/transferrin family substrate-binding protein [Planctomycetia bacterium]
MLLSTPARGCLLLAALLLPAWLAEPITAQQGKLKMLRIGTSGRVAGDAGNDDDNQTALNTMRSFIRNETGMDSEIVELKGWRELADKLTAGTLQIGVFQGAEFAWAEAVDPELTPLALAVNVQRYRYAHVLVKQSNPARDFAGLKGQSLSLPRIGQSHFRVYLDRQAEAQKADSAAAFFGKITEPDNLEDALDDVVDGVVQVAVAERVGLEAYKRRKPGRAAQLREVARSEAFSPPVVAARGNTLDSATRKKFQDGLIQAHTKEKERRLL